MVLAKEKMKRDNLAVSKIVRDKGLLTIDFYKTLTKRVFKASKEYPRYDNIIFSISTPSVYLEGNALFDDSESSVKQLLTNTKLVSELAISSEMFYDPHFPVYSVEKSLVDLLDKTDIPKNLQGIKRLFRNCLFLLPKRLYYTNINSLPIDWIFVRDIDVIKEIVVDSKYDDYVNLLLQKTPLTNKENILQKDVLTPGGYTGRNIHIYCGCSDLGLVFCSAFGITESGALEKYYVDTQENKITLSVSDLEMLTIQLLLFLQCPDHQPEESLPEKSYRGIGFNSKSSAVVEHSYRHLYLKQKELANRKITNHKEHASPITHWRRGHWRNQPCGEKLQDSKIIWIQPTLINATVG